MNTATFIGRKLRGNLGGVIATLGVAFPSVIIILILAKLITNFSNLAWVQNAFAGIKVCVCILILNAVIKLLKNSVVDKRTLIIFLLVLGGSVGFDLAGVQVSPVLFVVLSAAAGIFIKWLEAKNA